jgi:hypothetical protein
LRAFGFTFRVVWLKRDQHPDAPHALGTWAPSPGSHCHGRTAKKVDDVAPPHAASPSKNDAKFSVNNTTREGIEDNSAGRPLHLNNPAPSTAAGIRKPSQKPTCLKRPDAIEG